MSTRSGLPRSYDLLPRNGVLDSLLHWLGYVYAINRLSSCQALSPMIDRSHRCIGEWVSKKGQAASWPSAPRTPLNATCSHTAWSMPPLHLSSDVCRFHFSVRVAALLMSQWCLVCPHLKFSLGAHFIFISNFRPRKNALSWDSRIGWLRVFKWNEWGGPGERLLWNRESGEHKNCTRWFEFREAGATVGLGEIMRCVLLYESSSGVKPLCYFEERWKIRSRSGCWFFERHSEDSDHVEVARVMDWTSPPAHPFGVKIPSRLEWDFTW